MNQRPEGHIFLAGDGFMRSSRFLSGESRVMAERYETQGGLIRAARALATGDKMLFASLGHISDVSIGPLGLPLEVGKYNVRLPINGFDPAMMRDKKAIFIGCADKRTASAPEQIARFYGYQTSEIVPVTLAGGIIQPGQEEIDATHIDTSFTDVHREQELWAVIDPLLRAHHDSNPTQPLRLIFTGHDGVCAFVDRMFSNLEGSVNPGIIEEARQVHSAHSNEAVLMSSLIAGHAERHPVPPEVIVDRALIVVPREHVLFQPLSDRPGLTLAPITATEN